MASNKKTGRVLRIILLVALSALLVVAVAATSTGMIGTTARLLKEDPNLLQPPPPEQGGTCIAGLIIDQFRQPTGAGWTITIASPGGQANSAQADSAGHFLFDQLAGGTWQVELAIPEGWQPITPAGFPVTLGGTGFACANVRFQVEKQVEKVGCIDGYQTTHLGQGLSAWIITAANPDAGQVFTTTTDAQGYYSFSDLAFGTWTVKQETPNGWTGVSPSEVEVLVDQPLVCQGVDFVNQALFACVDVYKKDSVDGAGLAGWEITIKPATDELTIADITDGTGWVRFSELTPGAYIISERPQAGWQATTPMSMTAELEATGVCAVATLQNQLETAITQPEPAEKQPSLQAGRPTAQVKRPSKPGCRATYRVKPGDTLFRIAKRHEITLLRLLRYNPLPNPNLIYPRQIICIP